MIQIVYSNRFKKMYELCKRRGYRIEKLHAVLNLLKTGEPLPDFYREHKLIGNFSGLWECHIESDWLLVYDRQETELRILLMATGTHADLFE